MEENLGKSYSIVKLDIDTKEMTTLYDCIPSIQQADLLAQLSMCSKKDYELIYITPGWNRNIDVYCLKEYEEVLKLAEKYNAT